MEKSRKFRKKTTYDERTDVDRALINFGIQLRKNGLNDTYVESVKDDFKAFSSITYINLHLLSIVYILYSDLKLNNKTLSFDKDKIKPYLEKFDPNYDKLSKKVKLNCQSDFIRYYRSLYFYLNSKFPKF